MWPYWVLFMMAAIPAMMASSTSMTRPDGSRHFPIDGAWFAVIVILTLAIGLRYKVGGDWLSYTYWLEGSARYTPFEALTQSDPGYELINILALNQDWGIAGVNLISGAILATGLTFFCRSLPRPWLALAVSIPYLVIVVGMGYSRQAVALGFALLGYVAIGRHRYAWFVVWVLLGATFHKSAILLLPIAALSATRNKYASAAIAISATFLGYNFLLRGYTEHLIGTYINSDIQSSGALIRLLMNAVPAAVFVFTRKKFKIPYSELRLWIVVSMISISMLVLFGIFPTASTALDRMALYLIPLQLFVFSHLPNAFPKYGALNVSVFIVIYYTIVLFVWLNFADYSTYWIPYRISTLD